MNNAAMNMANNMANMNVIGGPVGAPMPMMNNGAVGPQAGGPRPAPGPGPEDRRTLLNTYVYDYFLRSGIYDVARAMVDSDQPILLNKDGSGRRRDEQSGNVLSGLGDDPMDTDSKDDADSKEPHGLPTPRLPMQTSETAFLYDWFCLFWDIFQAQRSKPAHPAAISYVNHTNQQSRIRQSQQQDMLRNMRPDMPQGYPAQMMRQMQHNGAMNMKASLARTAMSNNSNNPQMLQLQQQAKQNQMQRDPSDMDGNRQRPASPGSADNAPSPSKRPRLDNAPFNPNQAGQMMPNGRPAQGIPGQQQFNANVVQAHQMLANSGINPATLTPQQMQAFVNSAPSKQQQSIASYSQNLQQHHSSQIPGKGNMPNGVGPQGQGSPMMQPQADLNSFYNAGEMGGPLRPGPGGAQAGGGSNHALQDYQMQLMLLEQQNKKRLMMARQEQEGIGGIRPDGSAGQAVPGMPGPNGQPFSDTSPQARTGASPNPADQMKRGTPQISNAGIPSPLPDGSQSRGSPNPMNFIGNVDPAINAPNFGMGGNMVAGGQMNNMRPPPSSHPGAQQFNGAQMTQQQMMQARQHAAAGGQNVPVQWQGGPNGAMGPGPQGQVQGTPQQRNAMPPPSAPGGAAANANSRNNTSSPQQGSAQPPTPNPSNKAAPKKKADSKAKDKRAAAGKKNASNLNAAATAAAAEAQEEPPTPATPITPVNPASFTKGAAGAAAVANGQPQPAPPAVVAPVAPQHAAPAQDNAFGVDPMTEFNSLEFVSNPMTSDNLLNDFDFDSFLHDGDGDNTAFDFSGGFGTMEGAGEIGAD